MQLQRRVVVTGLGILSPIGNSKDTAWSNCINGVNGITEVDFGIADCPITVGGKLKDLDLSYLILDDEKLLIKNLCNFYSVVKNAALFLEPHRITNYLYDLSKIFHSYWGLGNQNKTMRIIVDDKNITLSRLVLVKTVSDIIKKSLKILKINCPESM